MNLKFTLFYSSRNDNAETLLWICNMKIFYVEKNINIFVVIFIMGNYTEILLKKVIKLINIYQGFSSSLLQYN